MTTPACPCDKICASATSTGTALVQTGDIVTASASASACSSVSYKRALSLATAESKQIAESSAIHDAHVINQTLRIVNAHSLIPSNADLTVGSKETPFSQSFSVDGFAQNSISIGNEVTLTSLDKKLFVNGAQTFTATNRQGSELDPTGSTYYGYGALGQITASATKQSVKLKDASSGEANTAYGHNTLHNNETGDDNTAVGYNASSFNTTGSRNTSVGYDALYSNSTGLSNTAFGVRSLNSNTTGEYNTAFGNESLIYNIDSKHNSAVGQGSLFSNTSGAYNTALGSESLRQNRTGDSNSALGTYSLYNTTRGLNNAAVGYQALFTNVVGGSNSSVGVSSLYSNSAGEYNTALGAYSLAYNNGSGNSAVGYASLYFNTTGSKNSALGLYSNSIPNNYDNTTCLGAYSAVTDSNQVQLGDSSTTTYCYGAVQDRSDKRDKSYIIDTQLGLDFINKLHPVDFKWNYRESYKERVKQEDGTLKIIEHPNDGSKKRNRYHHGLIAQEVKEVMNSLNVDFGGYQDHAVNGGEDVLTLGYGELITPMIKAIQEMNVKIQEINAQNQELRAKIIRIKSKNKSIITCV